jgi:hypothetical protein
VVAKVRDPPGVVDHAVRCKLVVEGRPILGHDDASRPVVTVQIDQQVGQALWLNGPAHGGELHA